MKLEVVKRSQCQVNEWAGGTTIQLAIYPPEAEYKKRNFQFRLSTAFATEEAVSPFTSLPGVERLLLILEGHMKVVHKGHHEMVLHPYKEIDRFDGGWDTYSEGKARDYNLMLGQGCQGELSVVEESGPAVLKGGYTHTGFFCGDGSAELLLPDGKSVSLGKEDLAVLTEFAEGEQLELSLAPGAKLVRADIACKAE